MASTAQGKERPGAVHRRVGLDLLNYFTSWGTAVGLSSTVFVRGS